MPRDINKTIEHIEQATWGSRERQPSPPIERPKPSPRAWRAEETLGLPRQASAAEREMHHRQTEATNTLVARSVKLTIPLAPEAVAALVVRDGVPRVKLTITFEGGTLRTEVSAKSVRKAQRVLAENNSEAVFCMLQGKLVKNEIAEAGLVAQVKGAPK
jgi:hypothetical protein